MLRIVSIATAIAGINAQTPAPTTPAPVDVASVAMETCVTGAEVVGPSVSLSRYDDAQYMEISISGDATRWFGFGQFAYISTYIHR